MDLEDYSSEQMSELYRNTIQTFKAGLSTSKKIVIFLI